MVFMRALSVCGKLGVDQQYHVEGAWVRFTDCLGSYPKVQSLVCLGQNVSAQLCQLEAGEKSVAIAAWIPGEFFKTSITENVAIYSISGMLEETSVPGEF